MKKQNEMDHNAAGRNSQMSMSVTFFHSTTTPLYFAAWQPRTPPQYALTCLFLVLLSIVCRSILAVRCNLAQVLSWCKLSESEPPTVPTSSCCADESSRPALKELYFQEEEDEASGSENRRSGRSRFSEVALRAVLDASLALVGNLL